MVSTPGHRTKKPTITTYEESFIHYFFSSPFAYTVGSRHSRGTDSEEGYRVKCEIKFGTLCCQEGSAEKIIGQTESFDSGGSNSHNP